MVCVLTVVVTGPRELLCAGLHLLLGGGIEGTVVGKQEVSGGYLYHLCDCLQETHLSCIWMMSIPSSLSRKASVSMAENMMLKSVGAGTQPCFTPLVTEKASDISPTSVRGLSRMAS